MEEPQHQLGRLRMGTRNSRLRRRTTKRGLASFVSFLLLFAFALGQSSLSALADDGGTDPVAAEEVVSDGSTDGAALPEVEAPAEQVRLRKLLPRKLLPRNPAPEAAAVRRHVGWRTPATPRTEGAEPRARQTGIPPSRSRGTSPAGGDLDGRVTSTWTSSRHGVRSPTDQIRTGVRHEPTVRVRDDRSISKSNGVVESLGDGEGTSRCDDWVTFFRHRCDPGRPPEAAARTRASTTRSAPRPRG